MTLWCCSNGSLIRLSLKRGFGGCDGLGGVGAFEGFSGFGEFEGFKADL